MDAGNEYKVHFKEISPEMTVEKLQGILKKLHLEVEETWQDKSCIGTYSLRVQFKGTELGSNGKGVSKEYASASAYAELFERYQNGFLSTTADSEDDFDFQTMYDEKKMTSKQLISQKSTFFENYFRELGIEDEDLAVKAKIFQSLHRIEYMNTGEEDAYVSIPFMNITEKRIEYLPRNVYQSVYGSNGMCAGNTKEEALVQGLAEIVERQVQKKIFKEQPSFPDVPEEYIKKFPYIYEMFQKLKTYSGYKVWMKDCSFGGKYPVAGLLILEENTGCYGLKLGCHPDFGVAMERTFTEAAQGQDIFEYVKRSWIDFYNKGVDTNTNICNSFKVGMAQYPYQLFSSDSTYEFKECFDVKGLSNREILIKWVESIEQQGYDVLIRDASILGFPSYHIMIPGLSEMSEISKKYFQKRNTMAFVSSLMMDCEKINTENIKYIIAILEENALSVFDCRLSNYFVHCRNQVFPAQDIYCDCIYFQAMAYAYLHDFKSAYGKMQAVAEIAKSSKGKDAGFYRALCYYFSARDEMGDTEKAMSYMKTLFDESICHRIEEIFGDLTQVIIKQYPSRKAILADDAEDMACKEVLNKMKQAQLERHIEQEKFSL